MKKTILTKVIFILILFFTTNIKSKYFIYKIENQTNQIAHITLTVEFEGHIASNTILQIPPNRLIKNNFEISITNIPLLIYFEDNQSEILNYFTLNQNDLTELITYEYNSNRTRTIQAIGNPQKAEFLKIIIHENEIEILLILQELRGRDITMPLPLKEIDLSRAK